MIESFSILRPFADQVTQGITTKPFGSVNDAEENFPEQMNKLSVITEQKPVFSDQCHQDEIIILDEYPKINIEGDAFITQKKELPLAIKVADCQGLVMFDPITKTIAAVHSGWRGSALNIIGKTIQKMKAKFNVNPANLLVGVSPSLGECCAEFTNPEKELPSFIHPYIKNKHVDFWKLSIAQCRSAGVPENQIEVAGRCTKCEPDAYFSHRNKDSGRMAVFIGLK